MTLLASLQLIGAVHIVVTLAAVAAAVFVLAKLPLKF